MTSTYWTNEIIIYYSSGFWINCSIYCHFIYAICNDVSHIELNAIELICNVLIRSVPPHGSISRPVPDIQRYEIIRLNWVIYICGKPDVIVMVMQWLIIITSDKQWIFKHNMFSDHVHISSILIQSPCWNGKIWIITNIFYLIYLIYLIYNHVM